MMPNENQRPEDILKPSSDHVVQTADYPAESQQRKDILKHIHHGIRKSEAYIKSYRRWDFWLLIVSAVLGTLATVLAGGTAAGAAAAGNGQNVITNTVVSVGGWSVVNIVISMLTAVATIAGTLHKTFNVTRALNSATKCKAKLSGLEISLPYKDPKEAAAIYDQILLEHPECFT